MTLQADQPPPPEVTEPPPLIVRFKSLLPSPGARLFSTSTDSSSSGETSPRSFIVREHPPLSPRASRTGLESEAGRGGVSEERPAISGGQNGPGSDQVWLGGREKTKIGAGCGKSAFPDFHAIPSGSICTFAFAWLGCCWDACCGDGPGLRWTGLRRLAPFCGAVGNLHSRVVAVRGWARSPGSEPPRFDKTRSWP